MVEQDWVRQEQRLGRAAATPEAIQAALARATNLFGHLRNRLDSSTARSVEASLADLKGAADAAESIEAPARLALYHRARWLSRDLALTNAPFSRHPLLFMQRNRYICQMLHEYMGYFYDYGKVPPGGGIYVLERPGFSLKTRDLIQGRLTNGNFTTLALSADARAVYFAFAERAEKKPDFYSAQRRSFHLFSVAPDGSSLRQLTEGVEDDFDPCPLPDGGVAFMSTRRGGFARCNNAWEPCASYTLHRMDADGQNMRRLSAHETSEWHPSVMNDGRLAYIRWDYVDRSAANFHGIWMCHPDGSAVASLFGNYTMRINACYQPRPIPGSEKLLFVAGAHHADVGGSLVMLDPRRAAFDPKNGEDRFEAVEALTPEVCFPESAGWPKSYFHSPWPLSEDFFLVSFTFDPLPGMSSGETKDTRTGLYYFDRFGNLEPLYCDPAISSMYPIPLVPRAQPTTIASQLEPEFGEEGEFLLADVRRSFFPMPAGRDIRELRVFQMLPKTPPHTANEPRIGHANAENARLLLGTVPVEVDGSAYFRVPAGKPVYFQAVDGEGRAVQSMRSVTYLQPGERRGCIGCHEPPGSAAASRPTLATRRPPSRLQAGPPGSHPFSYPTLVQPVLDRHCVRCHDGQEGTGRSKLALTGEPAKSFTRSYQNLKPYLRWYEWGGASISQIATFPGRIGADESPLTRVLSDATHRPELRWTDAERRQIYLWLDANVPFYGTYSHEEQLAQREGQPVPLPRLQ
ncbi:MAG: hypothetical protein NTW03_01200 [Verrucomicrobia bacterium]|nr:hypothetical protein [Verrucomicrobiota bacterium]